MEKSLCLYRKLCFRKTRRKVKSISGFLFGFDISRVEGLESNGQGAQSHATHRWETKNCEYQKEYGSPFNQVVMGAVTRVSTTHESFSLL